MSRNRSYCRPVDLLLVMSFLAFAPQASAVMSGGGSAGASSNDADYAAGRAAFDRKDWQGVIDHMIKVIARRPWHDDAHSLLGFAHRRLGDYDRSLAFYAKALELNPHNRGALEYLGEAYLDLDQPERAEEILERLAEACRRIAADPSSGGRLSDCEEWADLKAAYEAHLARKPLPEHD